MPWVKFSGDFDWKKSQHVTTAYKTGNSYLVSQDAANAAAAAGKGEILSDDERPRRRGKQVDVGR